MLEGLLTVIPARGGSKGLPGKNIRLLNGKPLLAYTIEAAFEAGITKNIFVSTDSKEIIEVAKKFGADFIERPLEISHDSSSTESALVHALDTISRIKEGKFNYILTLPPTSPLRSGVTIKKFLSHYNDILHEYDAMISLTETNKDYWIKDDDGIFRRLFPSAPRRRQDRTPIYVENSAIYITKIESFLKTGSILGQKTAGFIIDEIEAIDINNIIDLKWAEFVLKNVINQNQI